VFNVCPQCGEYSVEKTIDPAGPFAICPFCHYAHPFLRQPLFIITGASGTGKTAVCLALVSVLKECVVLESDILLGILPTSEQNDYRDYYNTWLRLAKNIGQAGRPVVLCGTALPGQLEPCPERRYFSTVHYLALICDHALLEERLRLRPQWRHSGSDVEVRRMVKFNRWIKEHAPTTDPPMTLYESSRQTIQETTAQVARWIRERL
jgi:predicted kinase